MFVLKGVVPKKCPIPMNLIIAHFWKFFLEFRDHLRLAFCRAGRLTSLWAVSALQAMKK
jgi:hypothetical protein